MRRLGSLLLLCFVSSTYAKDLPTFDTSSQCRSVGYSETVRINECVERERRSRELLFKLIDKIPAADVDDCIEYSKSKELGSYRTVATCILLYPNFLKTPSIVNEADATEHNKRNATEIERNAHDHPKPRRSESSKASELSKRQSQETASSDTTSSIKNANSKLKNSEGDAKKPAHLEFHFEHNLRIGSTGREVRELQVFLNANGFPVAESGPGSPGNEVEVFGTYTKNAVIKFQSAQGLPATGFFGSATRKYAVRLLGEQPSPSASAGQPNDP